MVSVRATVTVLVFFVIYLMASNTPEAYRTCCSGHKKYKLPFNAIKGYSLQTVSSTSTCRMNTMIFNTRKGELVCTTPSLSWAIAYVDHIKSKVQKSPLKAPQRETYIRCCTLTRLRQNGAIFNKRVLHAKMHPKNKYGADSSMRSSSNITLLNGQTDGQTTK